MGGEARKYLEGVGFDFQGVIRAWADRGWLLMGKGDARTVPVRMGPGGSGPRCYVFPPDLCARVMGGEEDGAGGGR